MMMIIGLFVFSLHTASYQELQRQSNWVHASSPRVGDSPAYQFVAKGEETITLSGSILPGFKGSPKSLSKLRKMADTGKAYPLIDGRGTIHGLWIIESLNETRSEFFKDGTARKIEFSLTLKQVRRPDYSKIKAMANDLSNDVIGKIKNRLP